MDLAQLKEQYDLHKAAMNAAKDRWLDEVRKGPDHAERAIAAAEFAASMADLDLDIDLLWRHFAEGEVPRD